MNTTESAICALEIVASAALKFWDLPQDARPTLVNRAENSTFIVEAAGMDRRILRLHRKNYHSLDAIRSELAWTEALRASGTVVTPKAIPGRDGCLVQVSRNGPASEPRYLAMFEFVEGRNPDEEKPLDETFEWLGETSGAPPSACFGVGAASAFHEADVGLRRRIRSQSEMGTMAGRAEHIRRRGETYGKGAGRD